MSNNSEINQVMKELSRPHEDSLLVNDRRFADYIREECSENDPDVNHQRADEILIELLTELGYHHTVEAFESLEKWYS